MRIFVFLALSVGSIMQAVAQTGENYIEQAKHSLLLKDYKTALMYAEKAVAVDDNVAEYHFVLGKCLFVNHESRKALAAFDRCIQLNPYKAEYYSARGDLQTWAKLFKYAEADFSKAIDFAETDSFKYVQYLKRATVRGDQRNFEGAYKDLMQAYAYDSANINVLSTLGYICDEVGRGEESLFYLLKGLAIDSTHPATYVNIGFKYQRMEEYEKSNFYLTKAIALDKEEGYAYSNRSYNYLKLGNLKPALRDIEKAIKLSPGNSWAYRNRALIYLAQGKKDKACEDLETALKKGFTAMYGDEVKNLKKEHCVVTQQ